MSCGLSGPKPAQIRGGLGVDRSITSEVVPTALQARCFSQADKPNVGYSVTPLWKLAQERAQREQEAACNRPAVKIPDGFQPVNRVTAVDLPAGGQWYYSEKRQVFWNAVDSKIYVWDSATRQHIELHEPDTCDIRISVGSCFHDRAVQVRHVIVKDLAKASQALRISIDHLDRPCSLYALYEGHRGMPGATNVCADFCAKHLHQKLLLKLAAYRGHWTDERLQAIVRESFVELDLDFATKHSSTSDGCCASILLVIGERLVVAGLGDVACVLCSHTGGTVEPLQAHALRASADEDDDDDDDDDALEEALMPNSNDARTAESVSAHPIRWTHSFGDLDFKTPTSYQGYSQSQMCLSYVWKRIVVVLPLCAEICTMQLARTLLFQLCFAAVVTDPVWHLGHWWMPLSNGWGRLESWGSVRWSSV